MKLSGGLFLSALCACAAAHSAPGRVFVYDPIDANAAASSSQSQPTVSPETARLILAQRLGVSQYHSIDNVDDDLISHLNAFGGKQGLLGAASDEHTDAHLLVWIEGTDNVDDIIRDASLYSASFSIRDPPSHVYNDALLDDLTRQAASLPKNPLSMARMHKAIVTLRPLGKAVTYNDFLTVYHVDQDNNAAAIAHALDTLVRASKSSITVILTPSSASTSAIKPYGTYAMPSKHARRAQQPEKILSLAAPSTDSTFSPIPNPADLEDFPGIQQTADKPTGNTTRLLGILPPYFSSLHDCETLTNSCSGHGACKELHKGAKNQRFVCVCEATREHVGEDTGMESKIRTTYWGGPACQKKDISMPFWLFVGSGVLLAGLISAGIGMLYSMGSEELPSVIGAGVSGPVRK